jgi:hypothetical protein
VYASKEVLSDRMTAALGFETAFRDFTLHSGNLQMQASSALNVLAKSHDAFETYEFLSKIRLKEYDSEKKAILKAKSEFDKNQTDLVALSADFERGIEKWKTEQKNDAGWRVFNTVIQLGIAIGATLMTGGVAAPAAVIATENVISKTNKVTNLIAQLTAIYKQLKDIYEKIKPVLEKLQTLVESITDVIHTIRSSKRPGEAEILKPAVESTDVFNVTAEWDKFDITVREMEESLKGFSISGKSKYFHALKTLVVNGKCYILAKSSFVQKGDELATALVQEQMSQRNEKRLSASVESNMADAATLQLIKRAMFDRVLAVRTLVFLYFFSYSSAYRFHTLSNGIYFIYFSIQ